MTPLLDVQHLTVTFERAGSVLTAVDDLTLAIESGETLGLVGESGSGKSVTALAILRLLQPPGRVTAGSVLFEGRNLLHLQETEMRSVRGGRISLIFQEPMTALNPTMRVGDQIAEALTAHGIGHEEARQRTIELLDDVRIPDPIRRVRDYPHQLSGGMRQRVMIAIALACRPPLVIADEPTTALDVTIQATILELIRSMIERFHMSLIFITHNLGVVAHTCDTIGVMYASHIVELGSTDEIFTNPLHPYTQGLLNSIPRLDTQQKFLTPIKGLVCNMMEPPAGCKFHPRCEQAMDICTQEIPKMKEISPGHFAACHLHN